MVGEVIQLGLRFTLGVGNTRVQIPASPLFRTFYTANERRLIMPKNLKKDLNEAMVLYDKGAKKYFKKQKSDFVKFFLSKFAINLLGDLKNT